MRIVNKYVTDITIEKICMTRSQKDFRTRMTDSHRDFESCVEGVIVSALDDVRSMPIYYNEELPAEQKMIRRDAMLLAYAICMMVDAAESPIDLIAIGRMHHQISVHLPHGNDYSLFVLCLAMYMMHLQTNCPAHFAEFMGSLFEVCKTNNRTDMYGYFQEVALRHKQFRQYDVEYALFTPSPKIILTHRDWSFYTHGFRETYVSAWMDILSTHEEKLRLCDIIERSFDKHRKTILETQDTNNEEVADF